MTSDSAPVGQQREQVEDTHGAIGIEISGAGVAISARPVPSKYAAEL